jgi:hypothetical protein
MEILMNKAILAIATCGLVISSNIVAAQTKTDMAKITCDDLSKIYLEEFVAVGAWMSGYYNAKRNNTVVDVKQLALNTKNVLEFCKANPKITVMNAIEKLLSEQN